MNATQIHAAAELRALLIVNATGSGELFSHLSRCPRALKGPVYQLLRRKGLIERHPNAARYPGAGVWALTETALRVQPGEEISAVV